MPIEENGKEKRRIITVGHFINSGKLSDHIKDSTRRVLIYFNHGLGDLLSFLSIFNKIIERWPNVKFDIGLNGSMGYKEIFPEALLVWRIQDHLNDYDFIFTVKYYLEEFSNPNLTKSEKCCIQEIGISPVSDHIKIKPAPLIGVHFNSTCMPKQLGCPENVALQIWEEIISCGCCPIETHFIHKFHNPENRKFNFIDMTCRNFEAKIKSLASIIGSCFAFVGVNSGNIHMALSILSPERIFMLNNKTKTTHTTKIPIANCSVNKYNGEVGEWLKVLINKD